MKINEYIIRITYLKIWVKIASKKSLVNLTRDFVKNILSLMAVIYNILYIDYTFLLDSLGEFRDDNSNYGYSHIHNRHYRDTSLRISYIHRLVLIQSLLRVMTKMFRLNNSMIDLWQYLHIGKHSCSFLERYNYWLRIAYYSYQAIHHLED